MGLNLEKLGRRRTRKALATKMTKKPLSQEEKRILRLHWEARNKQTNKQTKQKETLEILR